MQEKEILSALNTDDKLAIIALLQKLVKISLKQPSTELLRKLQSLRNDEDIAIRFWVKKVCADLKTEVGKPELEIKDEKELSLELLFQKLNEAQSHFIANEVLKKIFSKKDQSALEPILKYLQSCSDPIIISYLVKNLCFFFPTEKTMMLVAPYLKHEDDRVVANCVEGLEIIPSPKATLLINQMLSHENHRVKANAAKALANRDPETTKKVISVMLQSKEKPHFIIAACHAIGCLKQEHFLPELAKLVQNPLLTESALNAIEKIGGENAIGYLEALSETNDQETKDKIIHTIQRIKRGDNLKVIAEGVDVVLKAGKESAVAFGKAILDKAKKVAQEKKKNNAETFEKEKHGPSQMSSSTSPKNKTKFAIGQKIKGLAVIFSVLILAYLLTGSDPVEKELLFYLKEFLPKILILEKTVDQSYDSVTGNNFINDLLTLKTINDVTIPASRELCDILSDYSPKTKEVEELHELTIKAKKLQNSGILLLAAAINQQDHSLIVKANEKQDEARKASKEWQNKLNELIKKYKLSKY